MALTEEETQEILRLQKLNKQYEGLIRTSRDGEQQRRAKIELKKIRDRIDELCPDGIPADLSGASQPRVSEADRLRNFTILSKFSIQRASPSCDDADINLLSTVLHIWEHEFVTAASDSHMKLDFSLSSERDSHYALLENNKRNLKILTDTIEDFAKATREDFKAQLRDMKSRYTRHFLSEGVTFLKRTRDFWKKVLDDVQMGGQSCMNKHESVHFDRKFETATFFEGVPVPKVIEAAYTFLKESIEALNLPELPSER